ncbi:Hypothetical protein A7982_08763 [Minicystis rosea]|nr:Hypothetical protein A7982_08763 [Minicystis rosea]
MGKNVIVSEETVRDLLEAHASLSAWYYELWAALRAANATAPTPDDAARALFVERLATELPEIAAVARSIRTPRMYVPAPPRARSAFPPPSAHEAPAPGEPARLHEIAMPEAGGPMPPPLVDPNAVRYGGKD